MSEEAAPEQEIRVPVKRWAQFCSPLPHMRSLPSLYRKGRQAVVFLAHLDGYLVIRRILRRASMSSILQHNPRTPFKFIGNYVSLSLSCKSRLAILINHYRFVDLHFAENFASTIVNSHIALWEEEREGRFYRIAITCSDYDLEGDLSLVFLGGQQIIYTLSFTIAPGWIARLPDQQVILITRIQGAPDYEMVRTTTKTFGDVCPAAMLLTATRAVAMALGMAHLAGISTNAQVTVGDEAEPEPFFDYDRFWQSKGGTSQDNCFFHLSAAPHSKPEEAVHGKHRSRTLRRRRFKDHLFQTVQEAFELHCLKQSSINRIAVAPPLSIPSMGVQLIFILQALGNEYCC